MSATRIPWLSRISLLLPGFSARGGAAAPLIQTNKLGNISKSHCGCSGVFPTTSATHKAPKNSWNLSTSKNPFLGKKKNPFGEKRFYRASNGNSSKTGDCLTPPPSLPEVIQELEGVWDGFTCEIHGEPGVDVLHLQLQQAGDAPGAGGGRVAGVERQQLQQLLPLAAPQQQLLLLGIVPEGHREGSGASSFPRG